MSAGDSKTCPPFDKLPNELLITILSHIPHDDFRNMRLVCRRFNCISKDVRLWRKVELNFPRTLDQMHQLTSDVFPFFGARLEGLTITGFYSTDHLFKTDKPRDARNEIKPMTINRDILEIIRANCPGLKMLIIRNCKFMISPVAHQPYIFLDSLEKLEFHSCKLPPMPSNWMGQMSRDVPQHLLKNVMTLKFERCFNVDMEFLRYLRACPGMKILSLKGSFLTSFIGPQMPAVDRWYPSNIWGNLRVLDISRTGRFPVSINDHILNHTSCPVTRLFMEKCTLIPGSAQTHSKIEYLSVAGYRPAAGDGKAFDEIDTWASLPTMKQINASGCDLTQTQRDELMTRHKNVLFNLAVQFEESARPEF